MILRSLAAAAAVTAVVGAVVMRHWDAQAGRRVADLTRARASDEWRYEERVAELESDLEESRGLRVKLEHRLRAKRAELAGLRNEHAALLRRYATAETERASALEGRRLMEIEAVPQAPALPAARPAPAEETRAEGPSNATEEIPEGTPESVERAGSAENVESAEEASAVFSPAGSRLFLRANAALARFDKGAPAGPDGSDADGSDGSDGFDGGSGDDGDGGGSGGGESAGAPEAAQAEAQGQSERADGHERSAAASPTTTRPEQPGGTDRSDGTDRPEQSGERPAQPDQSDRADQSDRPDQPTGQATGHFTVPTAVAVVPAASARRPVAEGDFDFFGTKNNAEDGTSSPEALEAVQNEDLADVVGQEALAVHKAEEEAASEPTDETSRGAGQVIDLTAHDETEQIDVQGLRSAAS
ncbi:hypothetical protein GCM10022384_21140 [Streptomyces marokkonensis]|uniref:Secreted protein n=2 Tax=Streptomyces marokkonensis TaxID=324855 RepID=A0ABP7PQY4_9ACTN